jgi:hypothetical protein
LAEIQLAEFEREYLDGALALFAEEGWDTYTEDPDRTYRALTAPGSTALVAVEDAAVAGFVQLQSDGEIQAHLSAPAFGSGCRTSRASPRSGTRRGTEAERTDRRARCRRAPGSRLPHLASSRLYGTGTRHLLADRGCFGDGEGEQTASAVA